MNPGVYFCKDELYTLRVETWARPPGQLTVCAGASLRVQTTRSRFRRASLIVDGPTYDC